MLPHLPRLVLAASFACIAVACSSAAGDGDGDGTGGQASSGSTTGSVQPPPANLYGPEIQRLVIEVDYATNAAPYTGSIVGFGDPWSLFRNNAARLFTSDKTIDVPSTLSEMEELTDIPAAESYDGNEILGFAADHRDAPSVGDTATFYVLFLDGFFRDETGDRTDVLGVSLGSTGVIAMFKPVIESTSDPILGTEKYVEQATLVHEFGHAVGLVNNGVPMAEAHQDVANGAHCTNEDCIMYFAIEGATGAVDFVGRSVLGDDSVLFGPECLADTEAASQ